MTWKLGSAEMKQVLVSACLMGNRCRYDGQSKADDGVLDFLAGLEEQGFLVVEVCPEELGGLSTPRDPADLRGGDGHGVLGGSAEVRRTTDEGDVTAAFVLGARRACGMAPSASLAVLKARSPSCGISRTEIEGRQADGDGVFAALLRQQDVSLLSNEGLESWTG